MKLIFFIIFICFSFSSNLSAAAYLTGNDLMKDCQDANSPAALSHCYGYIKGMVDGHDATVFWGDTTLGQFCVPDNVNAHQIKLIVIKYINERPEKLHNFAASVFLMESLIAAFPCSQ